MYGSFTCGENKTLRSCRSHILRTGSAAFSVQSLPNRFCCRTMNRKRHITICAFNLDTPSVVRSTYSVGLSSWLPTFFIVATKRIRRDNCPHHDPTRFRRRTVVSLDRNRTSLLVRTRPARQIMLTRHPNWPPPLAKHRTRRTHWVRPLKWCPVALSWLLINRCTFDPVLVMPSCWSLRCLFMSPTVSNCLLAFCCRSTRSSLRSL